MHPSQMGGFRKTVIIALTIAFAGTLLIFTAQANLDLLKTVYPNPQFYMFGLLALEGGVVYWTGYYLLHLSGVHKGIAVIALAVDAVLSGTGFFYEMESVTKSVGSVPLPPVIVIVAFAVLFNVGMAIISHLIPSGGGVQYAVQPKEAVARETVGNYEEGYQSRSLAQTDEKGPGLLTNAAAAVVAKGQEIGELAKQKRAGRKQVAAPVQGGGEDEEAKN